MSLESCLPVELRGPATTITKVAAGLSGAGVYRVDTPGGAFVLKTSAPEEPVETWRRKTEIQQLAADAGVAPRIVHMDETRRAIVSDFVADRSFPALYGNPATRDEALDLLGRTLRRVHEIPLPAQAGGQSAKEFLAATWSGLESRIAVPSFVAEAVRGVLDEVTRAPERALVLSHNDVNPTNLVYDGERLLLLDWDTSGVNDPFHDVATISVFLLMDEASCKRLLAAHDDAPVPSLPPDFVACRRIAAVLCGTMFLRLSADSGFAGGGEETLETTASLAELYPRMRTGLVSIATGEGQRMFGLALVKQGSSV